jgi:hypothetical protein
MYLVVVVGWEGWLLFVWWLFHCLSSVKFDNIFVICGCGVGDLLSHFDWIFTAWHNESLWPFVYSLWVIKLDGMSVEFVLVVNSPYSFFLSFSNSCRFVSVSIVGEILTEKKDRNT